MATVSQLERRWTLAASEMVRRSRRRDAEHGCYCFRRCTSKCLANAANNTMLTCHRQGTYSLCLLSESNIIRRLALWLVQWEYPSSSNFNLISTVMPIVHTADKTRLSCLVGGVNRVGDSLSIVLSILET